MKKLCLVLFLMIAVSSFMAGCANHNTAEESGPVLGIYELQEADEPVKPNLVLEEQNRFVFNYSALSSYLPIGSYEVDQDYLTLKTDDGEYQYVFEIKNNTLVFHQEESSPISLGNVEDGSVFVIQEK